MKYSLCSALAALSLFSFSSCGTDTAAAGTGLSGDVLVDGSSTVLPISEAAAEEFIGVESGVNVTVGSSGTGGGFKKFVRSEIDINDASRPIKQKEIDAASKAGVEFFELPVAYDGIAVVVHKDNSFLEEITVEQLQKIWQSGSTVTNWKDVDASWPDERMKLFAPGVDSGTFDYFTEVVNGKSGNCRDDFTASEDDHVLVQGVAGERSSIGFFGFAYYAANKDKLKLLRVVGPNGAVAPSMATIANGTYAPLSRPLFIYVSKQTYDSKPQVARFIEFYLDQVSVLAGEVGYVGLPTEVAALVKARLAQQKTGSMFAGGHGKSLVEALKN